MGTSNRSENGRKAQEVRKHQHKAAQQQPRRHHHQAAASLPSSPPRTPPKRMRAAKTPPPPSSQTPPPNTRSSPVCSGHSPLRLSSSCPSPSFASSKCYEPPTPQSLPRPPTDWVGGGVRRNATMTSSESIGSLVEKALVTRRQQHGRSRELSSSVVAAADPAQHLKLLLKVEA